MRRAAAGLRDGLRAAAERDPYRDMALDILGPAPAPVVKVKVLVCAVVRIYVEIFRGTPMVLQAVFLYYGLPYFTDNAVRFDSIWMAAILVAVSYTHLDVYKRQVH